MSKEVEVAMKYVVETKNPHGVLTLINGNVAKEFCIDIYLSVDEDKCVTTNSVNFRASVDNDLTDEEVAFISDWYHNKFDSDGMRKWFECGEMVYVTHDVNNETVVYTVDKYLDEFGDHMPSAIEITDDGLKINGHLIHYTLVSDIVDGKDTIELLPFSLYSDREYYIMNKLATEALEHRDEDTLVNFVWASSAFRVGSNDTLNCNEFETKDVYVNEFYAEQNANVAERKGA